MSAPWKQVLNRVNDYCWEIPMSYKEGMRVPGRGPRHRRIEGHRYSFEEEKKVSDGKRFPLFGFHSVVIL